MATTVTINSAGTTYSGATTDVRRQVCYWSLGTLTGSKVTSVSITTYLRASAANTSYTTKNFVLMNSFSYSSSYWEIKNSCAMYQNPNSSSNYYKLSTYSNFCSDPLVNSTQSFSIASTGNVQKTFTISIPSSKQNISYWSGKTIYFGIYDNAADSPSQSLYWGTGTSFSITLTIETGSTVKYYTGSSWTSCNVYYYTGSSWVQCIPYYYNGSSWVQCNSG